MQAMNRVAGAAASDASVQVGESAAIYRAVVPSTLD